MKNENNHFTTVDSLVKNSLLRHSRLRRNDGIVKKLDFYDAITVDN